ncbi:MAG: pirin family protein [Alphaproteobacteria bacterium]
MQNLRHKHQRGATETGWLQSWHSFSFGGYHDPKNMGFGPLRVINEDIVRAGTGFDMHGHANMEIITYILSGAIEHKDSLGNGGVIRPGDVQLMSAGKGILHSEFNPSDTEDVHLLQIWIMPRETGGKAGYQQTSFDPAQLQNNLRLVVSPEGEDGSLVIKQDARLYVARLDTAKSVSLEMKAGRRHWFQVAKGTVDINGKVLEAGDALGLDNEPGRAIINAIENAEVLVFDLPR